MIWDSISGLLPGLLPANYRGIGFHVPDTSIEPGRRIVEHLFPGLDVAAYDDMGLIPQLVIIDGLIVGDDYVAKAKALAAAFERPGPGTLIHPWLGGMLVLPEGPASISFSSTELRVVRVSITFKKIGSGGGDVGGFSTISTLLSSAAGLVVAATGLISSVGRLTFSSLHYLAIVRSNRVVHEAILASGGSMASLFTTGPADATAFESRLNNAFGDVFDTIPQWVSPVAPAEEAPNVEDIDPQIMLDRFLSIAGILATADAPSSADRAILVAASIYPFAAALKLSTIIDHEARDSAIKLRQDIAAIADLIEPSLAVLSSSVHTAAASRLARNISAASAAAREDINEAIGRLPRVIRLELERESDAFLVANHYYGDEPGLIEQGYAAIVRRNRPRHPARLPPGRLEVLR